MFFCFYGWALSPTGFVIDYHFKSSECFGKRFEDGWGYEFVMKIRLSFWDSLYLLCDLLSNIVGHFGGNLK